MPRRPWSRFAMALLLLWQLNAAVALPPASADAAAHAGLAHCAHHLANGDPAASTHRPVAPVAPDCCGHCATCQCIELTILATAVFAVGETLRADRPLALSTAPRVEARSFEFFRPPI